MRNKIKKILEKKNKSKIVCLTAYSKNISAILDKYCDIILVGDSMANVLYGYKNTHKITLENIIQHTQSVRKGVKKSLLVVDMPIGSYRNKKIALKNAQKIIKKTGCDAVKIESNKKNFNIIKTLVKKNIISCNDWHIYYLISLILNILSFVTLGLFQMITLYYCNAFFTELRFNGGYNKYFSWIITFSIYYLITNILTLEYFNGYTFKHIINYFIISIYILYHKDTFEYLKVKS